jgi:hypothetical protein
MLQCSKLTLDFKQWDDSAMLRGEPCRDSSGPHLDVLRGASSEVGDPKVRGQPATRAVALIASTPALRSSLEDLLGDLWHARRRGDLGRLALLLYCEVRRWARQAGEQALAQQASALMVDGPSASREEYLARVDRMISELEAVHVRLV